MAIQENQHYVPKLYLRLFSNENCLKDIGIFNINTGFSFDKASIKGQAYKSFFYGKDLTVEKELSKIENYTSICFNDIIGNNSLPPKSINYKNILLKFVLLFELRNPVGAQNLEDSMNLLINKFPNFPKIPDGYKIKIDNPVLILMSLWDKTLDCCKDLQIKLLINKTSVPFITSDNPMIKYNQFLERHKYIAGITGLGTRGLQIFFPISSAHMLIFYDSTTYKIGNKRDDNVFVTKEIEIDQLNMLQCMNSNQIVFYNHFTNSAYVRKLFDKTSNFQRPNKPIIEEVTNFKPFWGTNQKKDANFLMHRITEIRINLQLNFIKELSAAKSLSIDKTKYQIREKALEPLMRWSR
jgi:hypothetical protein